jgi:hypothetical protein
MRSPPQLAHDEVCRSSDRSPIVELAMVGFRSGFDQGLDRGRSSMGVDLDGPAQRLSSRRSADVGPVRLDLKITGNR